MTNYGQSKTIHKLVCPCLPISQWLAFFAQIFPGNPQNDSNCPNFFVFDLHLADFIPCFEISCQICSNVLWGERLIIGWISSFKLGWCVHCIANIYKKHALQADSAYHLKIKSMFWDGWGGSDYVCVSQYLCWKYESKYMHRKLCCRPIWKVSLRSMSSC